MSITNKNISRLTKQSYFVVLFKNFRGTVKKFLLKLKMLMHFATEVRLKTSSILQQVFLQCHFSMLLLKKVRKLSANA